VEERLLPAAPLDESVLTGRPEDESEHAAPIAAIARHCFPVMGRFLLPQSSPTREERLRGENRKREDQEGQRKVCFEK
jgi:hypothetical protein